MPATTTSLRTAATLILLRDGPHGPETLMMKRHAKMSFAPGALVFPGGCLSSTDNVMAGRNSGAVALRIAAIRETFEECGILLACEHNSSALIGGDRCAELAARYRSGLIRGEIRFDAMLAAEKLVPAAGQLVPFGHWITPETRPKRFDTLFFVAAFSGDQTGQPDGAEVVSCVWGRPADFLRSADDGSVRLIFATRMNLLRLAASDCVADALSTAARQPLVRVLPRLVETPQGPVMRIPSNAGYTPCSVSAELVDLA